MTDKYAELRAALAAGPTPGPWLLDKFHPIITDSAPGSSRVWICKVAINTRNDEGRKNEAYIAAAHPETIRALLAERDALVDTANDQARANDLLSEREAGLLAQHERDSATLRRYAQQRDDLRKERDALRDALQAMVDDFDGCYAEAEPAMIKARAALAQHQGEKHA
ncbi:hypothetical protein NUK34_07935 [Kerstersia gyiorum]|uniref:hypothetical protein n=1 Tax=Kerstersia gyiorum TaxID=206506 RepID=UPI00214FDC76|nr:hypothetical protein [Kerstersia gyiorum]MCR4158780.1 hypothetical protein [Kerstersia gyiorum]